jgi:hypothetical protein
MQELGVLRPGHEDELDRDLDDALAKDRFEVAPRPFEVGTILEREQLDVQICHERSLHRLAAEGAERRPGPKVGREAMPTPRTAHLSDSAGQESARGTIEDRPA